MLGQTGRQTAADALLYSHSHNAWVRFDAGTSMESVLLLPCGARG